MQKIRSDRAASRKHISRIVLIAAGGAMVLAPLSASAAPRDSNRNRSVQTDRSLVERFLSFDPARIIDQILESSIEREPRTRRRSRA